MSIRKSSPPIARLLIHVGNALTTLGCVGLILVATGLVRADFFAIGISSGIRVVASVAISGCLLSAIGYGVVEFFEN